MAYFKTILLISIVTTALATTPAYTTITTSNGQSYTEYIAGCTATVNPTQLSDCSKWKTNLLDAA